MKIEFGSLKEGLPRMSAMEKALQLIVSQLNQPTRKDAGKSLADTCKLGSVGYGRRFSVKRTTSWVAIRKVDCHRFLKQFASGSDISNPQVSCHYRPPRVEIPLLSSDNLDGWIYRVEW